MSNLLDRIKNKLGEQGGFLKSASILAGGTAFAQILSFLVLPLLTRLYTPQDFAIFAVYTSILSILAIISNLRFELAIPLPSRDIDALNIVVIGFFCNIIVTSSIVIFLIFFKSLFLELINQPELNHYIWLIPIGVFLSGIFNTLQYWTTRKKEFSIISKTRISQSVSSSLIQVGFGIYNLGPVGLFIGQIANFSTGITRLYRNLKSKYPSWSTIITLSRLKKNASEYDKFPKLSTFEALASTSAAQLPIIIIGAITIGPEAGFLMLAMKVMAIPMTLLGKSFAQVYLSHAPEYYSNRQLQTYTIKVIKQVSLIAIPPLVILCLISPIVFPLIFGESWAEAGDMILIMLPWFIMQLLSSPVSMSLHITNNQILALMLQILGLIIRAGGLLIISVSFPTWAVEYYAFSGFVFYLIYLIVILNSIKGT